jgi:hypothetical protein
VTTFSAVQIAAVYRAIIAVRTVRICGALEHLTFGLDVKGNRQVITVIQGVAVIIRTVVAIIAIHFLRRLAACLTTANGHVGTLSRRRIAGIGCAFIHIVAIAVLSATLAAFNLCELATLRGMAGV